MTLPRDKHQIQNEWTKWLDDRADYDGLSAVERANLKLSLAPEIHWMIYTPDLENNLISRLAKIANLLDGNDNDLSAFDPWWVQRQDFLLWMLS